MPLEVKQFSCPNCNAALDLKTAGRAKSIVCSSCGSQIDLTSPDYQILGNVGQRPDPRVTQFRVGMQGDVQGQKYEIIGRVVYNDMEGDIWDEWLCLSEAGEFVWISDSENEGMAVWHSFVPEEPVEPAQLKEGERLNLRGAPVTVRDTGQANIDYLEGELTWKAKVNEKMSYAEADGPGQRISIEYTENEIEFYWGGRLDSRAVATAFGITEPPHAVSRSSYPARSGSWVGCFWTMVVVSLLIAISLFSCGGGGAASGSTICATPVVEATPGPGQPTLEAVCVTTTPAPRSSGGGFFIGGGGGSIRSGGSGGRSSGGGGHGGGGGGGGK